MSETIRALRYVPRPRKYWVSVLIMAVSTTTAAQSSNTVEADSCKIGPGGTAYVTRIVPVPKTISPEAQKMLARPMSDAPAHETLEQRRANTDHWQAGVGEAWRKLYPVSIESSTIAGVPVRIITPLHVAPEKTRHVLINLHGGGFNSDSGSLSETIPTPV